MFLEPDIFYLCFHKLFNEWLLEVRRLTRHWIQNGESGPELTHNEGAKAMEEEKVFQQMVLGHQLHQMNCNLNLTPYVYAKINLKWTIELNVKLYCF